MEELVKIALLGTAKAKLPTAANGRQPAELLVNQLDGLSSERQLLWRAGTHAVYELAGRQPQVITKRPESAPPETQPVCSVRVAELLRDLLNRFRTEKVRLLEALRWLDAAGLVLPPMLLPQALNISNRRIRSALLPVLGERGRWLSHFRDDWEWARDFVSWADDPDSLPPDAERTWQEGTPAARRLILEQVRRVQPARAREWLQDVWSQEKADQRLEFLRVLEIGLAPEDLEFLEEKANDRSRNVRGQVMEFLVRLPDSSVARRMCERADELLEYTPPNRRAATGTLSTTPPKQFDEAWSQDGLVEKPPSGMGRRAWWLSQVLRLVPPSHWETRLQAKPAELVAAAEQESDYGITVLQAWSEAAVLFRDEDWAIALWEFWIRHRPKKRHIASRAEYLHSLMNVMSHAAAGARAVQLVSELDEQTEFAVEGILTQLATPWSAEIGAVYLDQLWQTVARARKGERLNPYELRKWRITLPTAARAVPQDCFAEALKFTGSLPVEQDSGPDREVQLLLIRELEEFTDTIQQRQQLSEQIQLSRPFDT